MTAYEQARSFIRPEKPLNKHRYDKNRNAHRSGTQGQNILIAGGTGSGKSTLLGVLADAIPKHEHILLIEDTAEMHIRKPHIVSTESQVDTRRSKVTFNDLLKAVLWHRPDRIIVGRCVARRLEPCLTR